MEQDIMDLFRYNNEEMQVDSNKDDIDTEVVIHDNAFDTLSNCEQFFQKFKGKSGKEVFALFSQFQIDGIDMNKIDLLIMQTRKLSFQLEKKKGLQINMAGLIFSEEESVNGWINRSTRDIKFRKPKTYAELETWDHGHTYECFHNLDIEVINAEIKALHFCAHLFYEKTEVKTKMLSVIQDFVTAKNYERLKIGKLSSPSTQKQSNYKLEVEDDSEAEYCLLENFMQSFSLRDKLRKMRRNQ